MSTDETADTAEAAEAVSTSRWARPEWWSAALAVAVFLAIQLRMLWLRVPLGHDESVYLLRARAFADGIGTGELRYWAPYRAPGLSFVLSLPMRVLGESVTLSRAVVVMSGAAVIGLTGVFATRLAGSAAGAVAPWLVLIISAHTSYASLLLLDVPATAVVLVAVLLFERATRDGTVSWRLGAWVPIACLAAVYVRFGVVGPLVAGFAAVVIVRWSALTDRARRVANAARLATLGVATIVLCGAVLMVPAMTGGESSPLGEQQRRQVDKGLSPFASYRDMGDLVWPNGSRSGEVVSWWSLAIIAAGIVLTVVAAVRGHRRDVVLAAFVAVVLWLIATNAALAQMFGNYVGLGVPFVALLAAIGWGWAIAGARDVLGDRSAPLLAGAFVAVGMLAVAVWSAAGRAHDQVAFQRGLEVYRATGVELDAQSADGRCGVITSYVQIGWYSDCEIAPYTVPGAPAGETWYRSEIASDIFADGVVEGDELYAVVVNRGKRQPPNDELTSLLAGGAVIANVDHPTRWTEVWSVPGPDR